MSFFPLSLRLKTPCAGALALLSGMPAALAQVAPPPDSPVQKGPPPAQDSPAPPAGEPTAPSTPPSDAPSQDAPASSESAEPTEPEAPVVPPETDAPPSSQDAAPSSEPPAPSEQPNDTSAPLKARLDSPPGSTPARPHLPPPALRRSALQPEVSHSVDLQADRTEMMPGNYVARPVTLPKGTFRMEFGQSLVLWDVPAESALAPAFGLGITERLEIGVDAPLHHDPGIDAWAALHPRPHVAVTWMDNDGYEIGTRLRVLIPGQASIEPSAAVAVPVLFRTSPESRLDVIPEFHIGVGSDEAIVARVSGKGTWQISPGMFAGLGGTMHVGFVDSRDTGFDPEVTFGLSHQNYGRSFVDFVTHGFVKSLGGGDPGHVSRGAGFGLSLVFYPDLY